LGSILQIKVQIPREDAPLEEDSPLRFQAPDGSFFLSSHDFELLRELGISTEVIREIPEEDLPVRFLLPHDGAVNDPPPPGARLAVLSRLLAEGRANGEVQIRFLGRNRSVPPDGFVLDRAGGVRRYVWQVVPSDEVANRPELGERFKNLRAEFAREDTRVVLSLGSGGMKLFCHAPVLRLLETIGCTEHIDEVWGSSAGALVALLYSHGLSPNAIEQTGYDLYSGRAELSLRPSKFQILRHLIRDAVLSPDDSSSIGFADCAKSLARMLELYCAEFESRKPFYVIAYNLAACRTEVLTPCDVDEHLNDFMVQADPQEAALASSSVPLLFTPQLIERNGELVPYIDGSTTEDIPLHSVALKWDRDRAHGVESRTRLLILYVKLTGSTGQYRVAGKGISKLRLLQMVASAAMETMHARDVAILSARPDVKLLPLTLPESDPDFFETSQIPHFVRLAKESFPGQLDRIEEELREG
jgi:hypothetical protein